MPCRTHRWVRAWSWCHDPTYETFIKFPDHIPLGCKFDRLFSCLNKPVFCKLRTSHGYLGELLQLQLHNPTNCAQLLDQSRFDDSPRSWPVICCFCKSSTTRCRVHWLVVACGVPYMAHAFFSSEQEMYVLTSWSFWWADPFNLHPALKRNFFYRFVCLSKQWPDLDLKPGPSRRTVFFKPLPSNGKDMEALTVRERMEVGPMEWWWQRGDGFHFPKGMFFFWDF